MISILTLLHRNVVIQWCVQLNLCKLNMFVKLEVRCWRNAAGPESNSPPQQGLSTSYTLTCPVTWRALTPRIQGPWAAQHESLWLPQPLQEAWNTRWNQCQLLLSLCNQPITFTDFFSFFQAYFYRKGSCILIDFATLHLLMPGQSAKWTWSLDKAAPPSLL